MSLTEEEKGKLKNVVVEFNDVFAKDPSELGCTNVAQHAIDTVKHPPINNCHTEPHFLSGKKPKN